MEFFDDKENWGDSSVKVGKWNVLICEYVYIFGYNLNRYF